MHPSEIRRRILSDHQALRGMLLSLESLGQQVSAGQRHLVGPLRLEGEALLDRLLTHMKWEDVHLRPALLAADAWGEARAERLDRDHREQRALLEDSLSRVRDPSRPACLLARNLLDLIALLRTDMDEEERDLLDTRVLRDDVVGIDVETG